MNTPNIVQQSNSTNTELESSVRNQKKSKSNMYQRFQYQQLKEQAQTPTMSSIQKQSNHQDLLAGLMRDNLARVKKQDQQDNEQPISRNLFQHQVVKVEEVQEQQEKIERIQDLQSTMIESEQSDFKSNQSQLNINIIAIIRMQKRYKRKLLIRQAKKQLNALKKQYKYRYYIIKEIIETEISYGINTDILVKVMNLLKSDIGSKNTQGLFSNIKQIQELSNNILLLMQINFTKFHPTSMFADNLLNVPNFFKIYFEYYSNYNNSIKLLQTLRKTHLIFKEKIKKLEKDMLKGMQLEDYLIKPVQRLPKYVLLFTDLVKNTNPLHPDYKNLQTVLDQFKKVNNDNNKLMDTNLKNMKLFELQKSFGQKYPFLQANRYFIKEESLKVYFHKDGETRPCIVYFLNDLIAVTERIQKKQKDCQEYVLQHIVQLNEDTKCFKKQANIVQVISKESYVILILQSEEDQISYFNFINELIDKIKEIQHQKQQSLSKFSSLFVKKELIEKQQIITVHYIGTEEYIENNNKYNQYLLDVGIQNISQQVTLKQNQFEKLQQTTKKLFPTLSLSYEPEEFEYSRFSIFVEKKAKEILDFLTALLNAKEVQQKPSEILIQLSLPVNFYQLPTLLAKSQSQLQQEAKQMRELRKITSLNQTGFQQVKIDLQNTNAQMLGPSTPREARVNAFDMLSPQQQNPFNIENKSEFTNQITELIEENEQRLSDVNK